MARSSSSLTARQPGAAVIDLGQSKTVCAIARLTEGNQIEIVGASRRPSSGLSAGIVSNIGQARDVMLSALTEAERVAGLRAHRVSVSFSGGRLSAQTFTGASVPSKRGVTERDMRRALAAALAQFSAEGRYGVHAIPTGWTLDGVEGVVHPRELRGAQVMVTLNVVSALSGAVHNMCHVVERTGVDLKALAAAPYAAGLGVTTEEERRLGVTVIDFGAATTAAAVFANGALTHLTSVPIGGMHVTHDLAHGVSCSLQEAERLKRHAASVADRALTDGSPVTVTPLGQEGDTRLSSVATIASVVRARYEEILELIGDRAARAPAMAHAGRHVVLTGGGAQMKGLTTLAAAILSANVRRGAPRGAYGVHGAETRLDLAALVGLARLALLGHDDVVSTPYPARHRRGARHNEPALTRAWNWLREAV